jgi:hypothetical protein
VNAPLHIKCCQCEQEYPFAPQKRGKTIFITCPHCGFNHIVDFIPFQKEISGDPVEEINLKDNYAVLGGTRILSIDTTTDYSTVDDGDVTDWTKTDEFVVAVCIHSGGKETVSSTYKLQWQDDTDVSGYVDLASDAGSPEMSYTIADSSWSHGATVATGDQVCDIQGGDTRQAGERIKDNSLSDAIDLPDEYQSELWFGVNSDNADDANQYSFQLYSTAEGAAIGVCGATITMEAGLQQQSVGNHSMTITGTLKKKPILPRMGDHSMTITGVLTSQRTAFASVGNHSMVIAGTILKKIFLPRMGDHSMTITGHAKKKMFQEVGDHSMTITGTLISVKKFFQSVGNHAMTITGTLASKVKYVQLAGNYAITITGTIIKKISLPRMGDHSMSIAGTLKRKTYKTVGNYTVVITGVLSTVAKFLQTAGNHALSIIGTLSTEYTEGGEPGVGGAGFGSFLRRTFWRRHR